MSSPEPIVSHVAELARRRTARVAWEAAHPEIAAAWSEANAEEHERQQRAQRAAALDDTRAAAPNALARWGFPAERLRDLRNADLRKEHLAAAREYLSAPEVAWLVLLGSTGQGKTLAACYVARELLARRGLAGTATGEESQFATYERATAFARLSAYDVGDKAYFAGLCSVRLLVLDDLGAETLAGTAQAHLEELLDVRYAERRRTVLCSNLNPSAFKARYGERIADRMREVALIHVGKGTSLRRRPGAGGGQ